MSKDKHIRVRRKTHRILSKIAKKMELTISELSDRILSNSIEDADSKYNSYNDENEEFDDYEEE